MNDLLKSRNIKFMVAIYPDEMQVSPNQFESLVARFALNRGDYNLNLAEDLLGSFLQSKQIPYLDLLGQFRTKEQKRDLYLFRNTHWNKAGNELAAEMLFEYLIKQPYDFNSSKQNPQGYFSEGPGSSPGDGLRSHASRLSLRSSTTGGTER